MDFFVDNWQYVLAGFYALEKAVMLTPWKWDDILVSALREILTKKS